MTKADDVVFYLKNRVKDVTPTQLETLLYFSQGCHLALRGVPLFDARQGSSSEAGLSDETKQILDVVAEALGGMDPDDLIESSRQAVSWQSGRGGTAGDVRSREISSLDGMRRRFERICLPQAREPKPDELSGAAFELYLAFAHRRAFTPPVVSAEHAEAWQARLDAPPRELPGLREFLAATRERTET